MNTLIQAAIIAIPICYVIFKIDKANEKRHQKYNHTMNHDQNERVDYD